MKDNIRRRRFFVSPWPFVSAAILFALVTPNYLGLYGYGHWSVTQTAFRIEVESEKLTNVIYPKVVDESAKKDIEMLSKSMKDSSNKLKKAGSKIMGSGTVYHFTGLFSLVFTAFAFTCKPRWAGILSLPFSVYAMKYFFIIM